MMELCILLSVHAWLLVIKVHLTSVTTSTAIINLLRRLFVAFGLPEVVVSDNASRNSDQESSEVAT